MKNKYPLLPIFLFLSFLFFLAALISATVSSSALEEIAEKASVKLDKKSEESKEALQTLLLYDSALNRNTLLDYYTDQQIGLYLWKKDSLVFWNNSEIPFNMNIADFHEQEGILKNSNGHYLYFKTEKEGKTALACTCLKPGYALENNYLKNNFSAWLGIPEGVKMDTSRLARYQVKLNDKPVFSLKETDELCYNRRLTDLAFLFYTLGYLTLIVTVLVYALSANSMLKIIAVVVSVVLLRFVLLVFKLPEFIYHSSLYDLKIFGNAQSFFNGYLGDILLNAFTFLFLSFLLRILSNRNRVEHGTLLFGLAFVLFMLNLFEFKEALISLVANSTLNFDFINIFSLKFEVFVALGALGIYFIGIFITVIMMISFIASQKKYAFLKFILLFLLQSLLQKIIYHDAGFLDVFWPFVYALVLYVLAVFMRVKTPFLFGIQLIFMSLIISVYFNKFIQKNQEQDLDILSYKLSEKQDGILENEFEILPDKIKKDENLTNLIGFLAAVPDAAKEIELVLKQRYFSGYFDRFTVDFSLFNKNCDPLLKVKQAVLMNEGFFEDQIFYYSEPTAVEGLYYVKNNKKGSRYIGRIELQDKVLFVLMEPKQFEELGSFPDLLLDQSQQKPEKLKAFSHAVYRMQQITNRYGDFNYPLFLQDSVILQEANTNFVHHYYKTDEDTDVVISERKKNWKYFFTFNSYLLLFFSFIAYLGYLFYSAVFTEHFYSPTLTRRIQTIIITLLFLAMSAVGMTSGALVSRQFESDNKKQLNEKTQIIINELNSQFRSEQIFDNVQKDMINLKLKEYSRLFNTPISLFSKNGELFNTSEDKFYDLGLASPLMNPRAFYKLSQNRASSETSNENAGTLNYLSHYAPLFDGEKKLIGFVNLPYFSKQSDLLNELSGIISALINVYVILFVVSILAGLILSGFITQPLRFIKQQLGRISLGKANEKIVWQSDDEVGKLVSEYNSMLIKLEKSADLLAQSERESAWREMAKQVAHEIKNPLTPMKLNLQYLQHLIKNDAPDFKEKFEKASVGIIEQIDSLANIASAFSNFAKLPGTSLQAINLVEVIAAAQLVISNQKQLQFVNTIQEKEIWVKGDKDQCLRVFNNLFKNALQAMEGLESPRLEINAEFSSGKIIIHVKDNGCGIPEELQSKIFTPNFTTKSSGSGLGLAMVKNSMLGFEGDVKFSSEKNSGTVFYLEFSLTDKV